MVPLLVLSALVSVAFGQNATCGVQAYPPHTPPSGAASTYIVGGQEAIPHSWPWQVVLRFRDNPLTCGGVLIRLSSGEIAVVTAAQCVDGTMAADWKVDVGIHSRSAQESNQREYTASQLIRHELFDPNYMVHDIALIKVSQPITENDAVHPVCLTTIPTQDFFGKECVVTGWGATVEGGMPNDKLKEVYKPVLPDDQCSLFYGAAFQNHTMMCAGYVQGGQGACAGDQGGPVVCKNVNGQYDLIGIVSWGFGCARESYPAVYAAVHKYVDWINSK